MPDSLNGALFALLLAARVAAQSCDSHPSSIPDSTLDLAPPPGFVDICAIDAQLCRTLTAGYPPSVTTLAYFVTTGDWDAYRRHSLSGFTRYLIAQLAVSMTVEDLPRFKDYLHAQQGAIPDNTRLPAILATDGRAALGILDETPASISFGTIMKLHLQTDPPTDPILLVATNTAAVARHHVLSLYVYHEYRTAADVDTAKAITKTWIACIQHAN